MARTAQQVVELVLGQQIVQIATLTAENEKLKEELASHEKKTTKP